MRFDLEAEEIIRLGRYDRSRDVVTTAVVAALAAGVVIFGVWYALVVW